MKSWKIYSINNLVFVCLIASVFTACKSETSESSRREKILARVGNVNFTEDQLNNLQLGDTNYLMFKEEVLRNWIDREALFQAAVRDSILESKVYQNVLQKSKKEIAGALYLNKVLSGITFDYRTNDLVDYFNSNRNDFTLPADAFVLNLAVFEQESEIVEFRQALFEVSWNSALLLHDKGLESSEYHKLYYDYELEPASLFKIIKNLLPGEISIIIRTEHKKYIVVQLIGSFQKNEIPDYEFIQKEVEEKFLLNKKRIFYNQLMSELYSRYNVEIYKDSL